MNDPIVQIRDLNATFRMKGADLHAVRNVSLDIQRGEAVALVGESGCGKSTLALAILRLIEGRSTSVTGKVLFDGVDILQMSAARLREVRGKRIAIVFQDPMTSMNPYLTIGRQIHEQIHCHRPTSPSDERAQSVALLESVGIADASANIDRYPHEFSGGMRQRALLAAALSCSPELLIADEPTTALDVTTQAEILALLARERARLGTSLLFITHDLGIVSALCDRVLVMYAGEIVEQGPAAEVLENPRHPYTQALLDAVPRLQGRSGRTLAVIPGGPPRLTDGERSGCMFAPRCPGAQRCCQEESPALDTVGADRLCRCFFPVARKPIDPARPEAPGGDRRLHEKISGRDESPILEVERLVVRYPERETDIFGRSPWHTAVREVSITVNHGEIVGLVGESGCGKSTLARAIVHLLASSAGEIRYCGRRIDHLTEREFRPFRPALQVIFQDPYASLNPRFRALEIVAEPLVNFQICHRREVRERVDSLLETVGLDPSMANRYPHEFSGGQRQRLGIARALASQPKLIICDEPVSSLDVSVQAQILNMLQDLRRRMNLSLLLISHDLAVVGHLADRVAVMVGGEIVEQGPTRKVFTHPAADYTRRLLAAVPKAVMDFSDSDG